MFEIFDDETGDLIRLGQSSDGIYSLELDIPPVSGKDRDGVMTIANVTRYTFDSEFLLRKHLFYFMGNGDLSGMALDALTRYLDNYAA